MEIRRYYQVLSLLWSCILVVNISACGGMKPHGEERRHEEAIDLHSAVLDGNISLIQKTLEQQSSDKEKTNIMNRKDNQGRTILHVACTYRLYEVVKLLLNHGADMGMKDLQNKTPKDLANEHIQALFQAKEREIQKGVEEQALKNKGLCKACEKGNLEEVKKWIEYGAHVNGIDRQGKTALGIACDKGEVDNDKLELVKYLVSQGANVNQQTGGSPFYSYTYPLHLACKWKPQESHEAIHQEIVNILVKNGADVNAQDHWGFSPLHAACQFIETPALVQLLIDHGAQVDIATYTDKITPLYEACKNGYLQVAQKLINKKANVSTSCGWDILTNSRLTPLRIACVQGHQAIVELLLENGVQVDTRAVNDAASSSHLEISELLIKAWKLGGYEEE